MFDTIKNINFKGKKVILRVDFNVPIQDGVIQSNKRIVFALPTIQKLLDDGAKLILISHLGRPKGVFNQKFSLSPVVNELSSLLNHDVSFSNEIVGSNVKEKIDSLDDGQILMLENIRFDKREKLCDDSLIDELASYADCFVCDAFSLAHRKHATNYGLAKKLPSYMGFLMDGEISALNKILENQQKPSLAIVGGSKVSTKLDVLFNLSKKVDFLILGGGIANTFIHSMGYDVGQSLHEPDMKDNVLNIIAEMKNNACQLVMQIDSRTGLELSSDTQVVNFDIDSLSDGFKIFDAGDKTIDNYIKLISTVKTVLWNGPLGVFEISPFDTSTNIIAKHIASLTKENKLVSIAGGGDTVSALEKNDVFDDFSYVSLAGGAFLEWLEGKELPGIDVFKLIK